MLRARQGRAQARLLLTDAMAPGIRAAVVLALALLGDSLLYAVLPAHADAFGLSTFWVGLLLSINRFVRLGCYGALGRAFARLGERRLVVVAAAVATASTAVYAVGGPVALLVARMAWGLSFAVLSLASLSYATQGNLAVGRNLGVGRALGQLGPVLSLLAGSYLVGRMGPRQVFAVIALVTLAAIPLALSLPERTTHRASVSSRDTPAGGGGDLVLFGLVQLAEAALMTALAGLLLAAGAPRLDAAATVAWILVGRRLAEILLAAPLGQLAEAHPRAVVVGQGTATVAGLVAVAAGHVVAGACLVLVARAAVATAGPIVLLARSNHPPVATLARWSTWSESGSAIGPLLAGAWCQWLSPVGLPAALALVVLVATVASRLPRT